MLRRATRRRKKRPSNSVKYKPPVRRSLPSRRLLGLLAILASVLVLACIYFFFYIDRRVAKVLDSPTIERAGIYSAPLDAIRLAKALLTQPFLKRAQIFEEELLSRGYTRVDSAPGKAGEYRFDAEKITLIQKGSSTPIFIDLSTGSCSEAEILLESQPISQNAAENIRSSRFVALRNIPQLVQDAVLATEDERFYQHFGIDLIGIGRAVVTNLLELRFAQGGSTLTQQLAKNLILSPERSVRRKFLELFAAISIESRLSKEQILERYLNEVYLGQEGAFALHGFPVSAKAFFGKKIQDLDVSEAALLAGIIRAPSFYSPRRHLDRAIERRDTVIKKMTDLSMLSEESAARATKTAPKIIPIRSSNRIAQFFVQALEQELSERHYLEPDEIANLRIETGIDLNLQRCAEQAVHKGLTALDTSYPRLKRSNKPVEAGLVSLDPKTGLVRAWVGGRDFAENQFDHVTQGVRQIGSTVKPFLYLTALDGSLNQYKVATALSVLEDLPMSVEVERQKSWEPQNYDKDFRGDVSLRYALEHSLNMPAIYVAERVGFPTVVRTLKNFRVSDKIEVAPAVALGAVDTSLLRLTASFAALANGGIYVEPRLFSKTVNERGGEVIQTRISANRVASEPVVFVLNDILRGVVERGTASSLRSLGYLRETAGKTGTSDSTRDAWFIGFSPGLVAGVWVGFDDNRKLGLTGAQAAVPIWAEFMKCSATFEPAERFIAPPGVVSIKVDRVSGGLATHFCPTEQTLREVFVEGTEPTVPCKDHPDPEESIW